MGRLSATAVKAARTPGRYGDGDGLYLLIGPTGARSWVCRVQKHGKRRDFGLGSVKKVTLAQAREKATKFRSQVEAGIDPIFRAPERGRHTHFPPGGSAGLRREQEELAQRQAPGAVAHDADHLCLSALRRHGGKRGPGPARSRRPGCHLAGEAGDGAARPPAHRHRDRLGNRQGLNAAEQHEPVPA